MSILARAAEIAARRGGGSGSTGGVTMDIDDKDIKSLQKKVKTIGNRNPHIRAGLNRVGAKWVAKIKRNFRASVDPYGKPWEPLKQRRGMPLIDTGALRNSIKYDLWGARLRLMSRLPYANYHNNGVKSKAGKELIPKRRFTPDRRGIPPKWEQDYEKIMVESIRKALG